MSTSGSSPAPDPGRVRSAGVCADLSATTDLFVTTVETQDRHLVRPQAYGDNATDNLMEHLPWLITQVAKTTFARGGEVHARDVFETATGSLLAKGPQDVSQLPEVAASEAAGWPGSLRDLLSARWREQVCALFEKAWTPWGEALSVRAQVEHPLVRVAVLTRNPGHVVDYGTALAIDPIIVRGYQSTRGLKPLSVASALVHPAEAEELLDDAENPTWLVPSAGVSQDRIDTVRRLRAAVAKRGEDPPLRCLAAALVAAAAVVGEPVFTRWSGPSQPETTATLTALLPPEARPKPKPPARPTAGRRRLTDQFPLAV